MSDSRRLGRNGSTDEPVVALEDLESLPPPQWHLSEGTFSTLDTPYCSMMLWDPTVPLVTMTMTSETDNLKEGSLLWLMVSAVSVQDGWLHCVGSRRVCLRGMWNSCAPLMGPRKEGGERRGGKRKKVGRTKGERGKRRGPATHILQLCPTS